MSEKKIHLVQSEILDKNNSSTPVTLRFEHDENNLVEVFGLDEMGDHTFDVSLIIRRKGGGDECYVCLEPPCPPNRYTEVNPCPQGGGVGRPTPRKKGNAQR